MAATGPFLDAVRDVLPGVRARSAEAEAQRELPAATVAELERCGVFSGLQPRRWAGLELAPSVYFQGVVLVASACGAAGWVGGVLGVHP